MMKITSPRTAVACQRPQELLSPSFHGAFGGRVNPGSRAPDRRPLRAPANTRRKSLWRLTIRVDVKARDLATPANEFEKSVSPACGRVRAVSRPIQVGPPDHANPLGLASGTVAHTDAPPRVAVVGCGYWGKNLARNFQKIGALAAIHDPDSATADTVAGRYMVPSIAYSRLLAEDTFAAVVRPGRRHRLYLPHWRRPHCVAGAADLRVKATATLASLGRVL